MKTVLALVLLSLAVPLSAHPEFDTTSAAPPLPVVFEFQAVDHLIMRSDDYLSFHPDQQFRRRASDMLVAGRPELARTYFQRGAHYADKLSQAALAELWWEGRGGAQDRAIAYAWIDLAAERGTPYLLAKRELYWQQMSESERARVAIEGAALKRQYGDAVAKPRLAAQMRRGLAQMTGSRTGGAPRMQVCPSNLASGSGGCAHWVAASDYYAPHHWKPDAYWRMQDEILSKLGERTTVHTGAVDPIR